MSFVPINLEQMTSNRHSLLICTVFRETLHACECSLIVTNLTLA